MKAIVTVVIKDMVKGEPKQTGIDVFGRQSTDVLSRHKSFLVTGIDIKDIEKFIFQSLRPMKIRISRIEVVGD